MPMDKDLEELQIAKKPKKIEEQMEMIPSTYSEEEYKAHAGSGYSLNHLYEMVLAAVRDKSSSPSEVPSDFLPTAVDKIRDEIKKQGLDSFKFHWEPAKATNDIRAVGASIELSLDANPDSGTQARLKIAILYDGEIKRFIYSDNMSIDLFKDCMECINEEFTRGLCESADQVEKSKGTITADFKHFKVSRSFEGQWSIDGVVSSDDLKNLVRVCTAHAL